jgi:Na+/glutamate symporter
VVCILGVLLFTFKPYLMAQGFLGKDYQREQMASGASALHLQHGTGQAEAFLRATSRHPHDHHTPHTGSTGRRGGLHASRSFSNFGQLSSSSTVQNTPSIELTEHPSPTGPRDKKTFSFDEDMNDLILVKEDGKSSSASLGAHLALIALTAFLSFGVSLTMHLIEIQLHIEDHWLSGVRMFKLTMCCAMLCMVFILQRARVRFNRDWFMHMCGLMLDLLVIAALSKAHPKPRALQQTHYLECGVFVILCLVWNVFCFVFVARRLFPNYWFERALTLAGDSMGHSYTGLLFVRTLDPAMESPVPAAYAYKLLLFFIPSSGAKQTIVMTTMKDQGPWVALLTCVFVVFAWLILFDSYFRRRFVSTKDRTADSGAEEEAQSLIGSPDGTGAFVAGDAASETPPQGSQKRHRSIVQGVGGGPGSALDALFSAVASEGAHEERHIGDSVLHLEESPQNDDAASAGNGAAGQFPLSRNLGAGFEVHASETSSILTQAQMNIVASFLSPSNALKTWQLTYSLRQHGASLSTLLALNARKTRSGQRMLVPCLVVIEDSWGYVFGGFISPTIQSKSAYYGNGESFVFSVVPAPRAYKWTGKNELFVLSNANCMAMGGGGEGYAWQLDDELDTGVSCGSDTFGNAQLSSSEFFKCLNIEVWALDAGFSV